MNQDIAQGNWKQLSGKIKQKWGKLTDDDLLKAKGDKEYLVGRLHEQYGIAKDKVEDELQTLGYREDDQDVDLRSSDRSAAGRMDAAGFANAGSGNRSEKLNASGREQDASGSSHDMDSGDSHESGSRSFRQGSGEGAGHTLEASPDKQPQRSGSNNPSNPSGTGTRNPSDKSSQQQQKGGRNSPGSSSGNR
jgi:uncharacterized protein YjbJ (UPF0337 family)